MRKSWRLMAVMAGAVTAVAMGSGVASAQQGAPQPSGDAGGQPALRHVATVKFPASATPSASFDISWVDPATQTYYLSDRTNKGIDAVDAAHDTFDSIIGAGDFTGAGATATAAQKAACGATGVDGPDGVLSLDVGGVRQLWAGDGVDAASPTSGVKVFDLSSPGSGKLATTVSTGGSCRADEMAYDPADHLVAIANDVDSPPFISLISVHRDPAKDKVVKKLTFSSAIDGIEQTAYDSANGMFYSNIPQVPSANGNWVGEVAMINPHTMSVVGTVTVPGCSPGGLAIDEATQQMLLGCSSDAMAGDTVHGVKYHTNPAVSIIMSARDGDITRTFHQVGGSDEVWFDPATSAWYLGASSMTANGLSTGKPDPVLGVIGAGDHWIGFVGNIPTAASAHSVAANPVNGQVFVPIPGKGIDVFAPAWH